MLVFIWDAETKEYLRTQKAQKNPKKHGEYLIPANSTTEQIPDIEKNKTAVWNGEHWQIVEDYRGQYMVDQEMIPEIIRNFGTLPEGYVLITEYQLKMLEEKGQNYFIISDGVLIENPDYKKEQEKKEKQIKINELQNALNDIDIKKIRAASAILLNTATDEDISKLKELETKTIKLRKEIQELLK